MLFWSDQGVGDRARAYRCGRRPGTVEVSRGAFSPACADEEMPPSPHEPWTATPTAGRRSVRAIVTAPAPTSRKARSIVISTREPHLSPWCYRKRWKSATGRTLAHRMDLFLSEFVARGGIGWGEARLGGIRAIDDRRGARWKHLSVTARRRGRRTPACDRPSMARGALNPGSPSRSTTSRTRRRLTASGFRTCPTSSTPSWLTSCEKSFAAGVRWRSQGRGTRWMVSSFTMTWRRLPQCSPVRSHSQQRSAN